MGLGDKLDALDELMDLVPFFRCPNCTDRKADKISLTFNYSGSVHVKPDNPTKTFYGVASDIEVSDWRDIGLHCSNCNHDFPVPEGWKWNVK